MPTLTLRRRDAWWDLEGPAAKRRHRYQRFISFMAFVAALTALGGASMAWAIHLGFTTMMGLNFPFSV